MAHKTIVPQATAIIPFFSTSVSCLCASLLGRFSPRSHWRTSPGVTLNTLAKTVWLAAPRSRKTPSPARGEGFQSQWQFNLLDCPTTEKDSPCETSPLP